AVLAIRHRSIDMNVLMSLAVVGAVAIGDWIEGATVVALYNIGTLLQAYTMEHTRRSIRALIELSPKTARVGGRTIPVEQVQVGDVIDARPGERISMDGEVLSGSSAVNQAPITGESAPVMKQPGDTVFAGTLNGHGAIEVTVTRRFKDT